MISVHGISGKDGLALTRYSVNGSILLTRLALPDRLAAIREAGFGAVEFWWPFPEAAPPRSDLDRFAGAIEDSDLQLSALNFFGGDLPAGERGLVCRPDRSEEFAANVSVMVGLAERLGCRAFNALYGIPEADASATEETAIANLTLAAKAVATFGGTVLLEPLSGVTGYPLKTAADVLPVLERLRAAGADNVKLLADFYHLAGNGDDVPAVITEHAAEIGHVQIADVPGRGAPGTGDLPLREWIAQVDQAGYDGWIGLEYQSAADDPFGWLPRAERERR